MLVCLQILLLLSQQTTVEELNTKEWGVVKDIKILFLDEWVICLSR